MFLFTAVLALITGTISVDALPAAQIEMCKKGKGKLIDACKKGIVLINCCKKGKLIEACDKCK